MGISAHQALCELPAWEVDLLTAGLLAEQGHHAAAPAPAGPAADGSDDPPPDAVFDALPPYLTP